MFYKLHTERNHRWVIMDRAAVFARNHFTQNGARKVSLVLDQEGVAGHLLWLGKTHGGKDRWRNIAKDTISLLQAPPLGRVSHDERDLVGGVGSLWISVWELHLLGVSERGQHSTRD